MSFIPLSDQQNFITKNVLIRNICKISKLWQKLNFSRLHTLKSYFRSDYCHKIDMAFWNTIYRNKCRFFSWEIMVPLDKEKWYFYAEWKAMLNWSFFNPALEHQGFGSIVSGLTWNPKSTPSFFWSCLHYWICAKFISFSWLWWYISSIGGPFSWGDGKRKFDLNSFLQTPPGTG